LAPHFFPLLDKAIADGYSCAYAKDPAGKYLRFMRIQSQIVDARRDVLASLESGRTLLKVLDEYYYAKFTKDWS
jgi:outer membrane protein assembly factor BamD (BamD/ComL family)